MMVYIRHWHKRTRAMLYWCELRYLARGSEWFLCCIYDSDNASLKTRLKNDTALRDTGDQITQYFVIRYTYTTPYNIARTHY